MGELRTGGAERQMVTLARLLHTKGYQVAYLCSNTGGYFQNDLDASGIPIIRVPDTTFGSLLGIPILRKLVFIQKILRKEQPETVISFLWFWNFANAFLSKFTRLNDKVITGLRFHRDWSKLSFKDKFYLFFERYADVKVSNSEHSKKEFIRHFPEMASKMLTIYNMVNLPEITSHYIPRKNNRLNIIVPASYYDIKNPMGLLDALSTMSQEEAQRIHIDWYGNIKNGERLYNLMVQFIQDHHLSDVIELHDATKDIINKMNEADVVALFSKSEGLPNSICEGMMLGKPIIMSRVSDYEIMVDAMNGFLCDSNDVKSIKDALISSSSLTDENLMKMGEQSKFRAQKLFSADSILQQWIDIL